ncbi:DUF2637 domain-containing protein [Streptomyces sp. NPDC014983]|uniref:DUF2637 domain-containing protein n=1 Tax=Streptomyces sp. NPDC014983 TaxID=3364933 RepID=UPI0037000588
MVQGRQGGARHCTNDLDAPGQAWAYPVSADLLLVAAWRRLRAGRDRSSWTWFAIAPAASLGADVATAGLLDLHHVPAWLRTLVAGWPALAFLGGTLLVHAPTSDPSEPDCEPALEVSTHRTDTPDAGPVPVPTAELPPAQPKPPVSGPAVPPALLDHARSIADAHRNTTGEPITADALTTRLGLPTPTCQAIAAQLQLA